MDSMVDKIAEKVENLVGHHRKLEEDLEELRSEWQVLKWRKTDVNSRIQAEVEVHSDQEVKKEVEGWLEDVQKIEQDIQGVEERVGTVPYYGRASLDKLVRGKIEVVKRIQERGIFEGGLGIERAPACGTVIPTENLEGEISTKDEIWGYLMGNEVGMIGVCGIGGVGKTTIVKHINNALLSNGRFQKVIWVTVSYPLNVLELQKKIALAMGKTLPEDEEKMIRAGALMDIMGSKSFVLILDDVWDKFSLTDVGIPEPVQNKSKVVITSRSVEVCNYLDCKIVKVQPLSPQESLSLFLDRVGRDVLQKVSGLEETLKLIVEECDGLPLAIVVIAGSMKGEYDIAEWRNALNELRQCVRSVKCVEDEIFGRLRFSYDRLRSLQIQECFLYCSLFREDYEFFRENLIEDWIDEGLIVVDELGSRQAAYDRGRAFLNRLLQNCLLEECVGITVKMHDVVRDMAIKSIGLGCGYMVKAGIKLNKVPNESKWEGDLKKVSLMANDISKIPVGLSPKSPLLSTLILSNNPTLSEIPSSFFESMVGLKVLDLAGTGVKALPDSISNLVNLFALRLRECRSLKHLPSLAKLRALKKLDLCMVGIEVVPQGMEMLGSLEYLDLSCQNLKEIPTGIFPNLSSLQYLVVYPSGEITRRINIEEAASLSNLESLECRMEVQDFNYLVNKSKDFDNLTAYEFRLTRDEGEIGRGGFFDFHQRKVSIHDCEIGEECIVLPDTLEGLWICNCKNMKNMRCSLNKTVLLENATELRRCFIEDFEGIECIVELDSSSSSLLNKLEDLSLHDSSNLSVLVRVEGVVTPPQIFSNLKYLWIRFCSAMRNLVPLELLQALQNLEGIQFRGCEQMEEIIASSDSDASSSNKFTFTFPNLRTLILVQLGQLKSICGDKGVMVCDSIEEIQIIQCPKLKRFPLQLPLLDNGEPSPPRFLKKIGIDEESKEWWESVVELNHPNAKNILQPFLKFTPFREWSGW
ncbi:hypothetical protein SLEP1_g56220 [Rubroshorea leprosula]|uniref:NB-ARC domain-containing protein n=1 Tax=Rubroshorea leprosula TaxID=152421 RepID=A0AAV5MIX9_9ROSI|nr:hypothetical protein SLEP1_g56220 [Rubroshorea leprosula]